MHSIGRRIRQIFAGICLFRVWLPVAPAQTFTIKPLEGHAPQVAAKNQDNSYAANRHGMSPLATFSTSNPVPLISSLSPSSGVAGGAAFTLTVNGSNFIPTSVVQWKGRVRATSYVTAMQLKASITVADIATPGSASVTVVNPPPGGGTSGPSNFAVTGTIPSNVRFVAPNGSDSNPGTITQPYLTIQKCATTVASGWTCEVRAGTYRETVTPNSGITITSYDPVLATIDGSDPVTGWTLYQGAIYEANVQLGTGDTNQVFVGDQMMTEARWPNGDDLFNVNWATAQAGTTTSQIVDSTLPIINWTGAKIHLWSGSDPFGHETGTVTASGPGQITIDIETGTCPAICPTTGGYYYLFGILGVLDAEREWFYDPNSATLYFWAPGSVQPNTLDVRAKQRPFAFDLSGKSNVTIQDVNLFASTINTDAFSTNNILDGINAQYASHFTTLPVAANDPTGSGFSILGVHDADTGIIVNGTGNLLRNSTIAYSAGDGVALLGNNNTIKNNLIHHVDYIGDYASGIVLAGNGNTIQNNTIHAIGRQAIVLFGVNNDEISYNNLFDAMMLSRDGGEIYTCCNLAVTGTRFDHNWIHDTQSLISGAADNFAYTGVYIDNANSGFEVDQNIFWNNEFFNIYLHGAGFSTPNNNNVHNNSIPDLANSAIRLWNIPNCGTTQVVDNLVLVPVNLTSVDPACKVINNNANAPGATEMTSSVQVGCNFTGCYSSGPPAISGGSVAASIAIQPLSVTVWAGQRATFKVTAAGSTPISYQWFKNGVNISGATSATYTIPATTTSDNGALFTVQVSNFVGGATSDPAILTVQTATRTDLSAVPNPASIGRPVTLTATVSSATGSGTPSGTVTFEDGATKLGSGPVPLSGGVATLNTAFASLGTHVLTAFYSGDNNFVGSPSNVVNQVVQLAPTITGLSSGMNPTTTGASVTFTATATSPSSTTPTGTVNFSASGPGTVTPANGIALDGSGVASAPLIFPVPGAYSVQVSYGGDSTHGGSVSQNLTEIVNCPGCVGTNASVQFSVSPFDPGEPQGTMRLKQTVTFTVTISANSGSTAPTGSVQLQDRGVNVGAPQPLMAVTATSASAVLSVSSLSLGSHSIVAVYPGNAPSFGGSLSLPITIQHPPKPH